MQHVYFVNLWQAGSLLKINSTKGKLTSCTSCITLILPLRHMTKRASEHTTDRVSINSEVYTAWIVIHESLYGHGIRDRHVLQEIH